MAVPLLAIFAAGLGLQQAQIRGQRKRATEASELQQIQLLQMSGTARNLEQITPEQGMILQRAVETTTPAQFQSMLRGFMRDTRSAKEFAITSGEAAATGRVNRENTQTRLAVFEEESRIALNPELREQFKILDDPSIRQVTNSVTGRESIVPTRINPLFKAGVEDLRTTTTEAEKINTLLGMVAREGLQQDPSAPITTLMTKAYNDVVAFVIEDLGFGVPQAQEFVRVELGIPSPTAWWTALRRGEAATIAPLMEIMTAKQRQLGNIVRDQADWNVDQLDTTRALNAIGDAANLIPIANKVIGDITQAFGGRRQGGQGTIASSQAQVLAARANLLFNPDDPSAQQRLRQSQEFAKRLGEDPDASLIIPDILPEPLRTLSGAAEGSLDAIVTFLRKGK